MIDTALCFHDLRSHQKNKVNQKGFKALVDALGYVDVVRFLKQFDNGNEDYTQERKQRLDPLSLDEIWTDLQTQPKPD
jgi:hypothetical protein